MTSTQMNRRTWVFAAVIGLLAALLPMTAQAIDWSSDTSDLSATGQNANSEELAVSADGSHAVSVWTRYDGSTWIVQARLATLTSTGATSWGAVSDLSDTGQTATHPEISISSDGSKVTAIWLRNDGSNDVVQSRSATVSGNSATWGAVTRLSDQGRTSQYPQVALSSDGAHAIAVWYRSNGSNNIVQTRSATIADGVQSWGAVTDLSATGRDASAPQVALSSDGTHATAVWQRSNGSNWIVQSKSATLEGATSTWGGVSELSPTGQNGDTAQIGLSADGSKATLVWHQNDTHFWTVQTSSATVSGTTATWGAATQISASGQDATNQQMALSSDGERAVASWQRYDGNNEIVQAVTGTVSGTVSTWGTVTDLTATGQDAEVPSVGISTQGTRTTVAWQRSSLNSSIIQSRSAILTGTSATWGSVAELSTAGQDAYGPQLGLSGEGTVSTVDWRRSNGAHQIVQAKSGAALSQVVTFNAPASTQLDQGPVTLSASASSGLSVTLASSTPNVCTVSGASATLVAAGTCTITASQAGDVTYAPAADVQQSFSVTSVPTPATVPKKLTGVSATSKKGKVTVKWKAPITTVTGYTVQSSTNKKKWKKAGTAGPSATRFVWKKGKKGKTYFLRVGAKNSVGRGPWSKPVKVRIR